MANINGIRLFTQKARQWGGQGSSVAFPDQYIRAVNFAIDEYAVKLDLSTKPSHITSTDDDIGIDDTLEQVIDLGIDYWLIRFGSFRAVGLELPTCFASFQNALTTAMTNRDRAAAVSDDEDVVGLL